MGDEINSIQNKRGQDEEEGLIGIIRLTTEICVL